jgi:hypothetical protein
MALMIYNNARLILNVAKNCYIDLYPLYPINCKGCAAQEKEREANKQQKLKDEGRKKRGC